MLDINGIEIKTGMIVEVKNSYFKNDNGTYVVMHSPGDCTWFGSDYSLHRIKRNGDFAKSNSLCFWPIHVCTNDYHKRIIADAWNKENATIEVKPFDKMDFIKDKFRELAAQEQEQINFMIRLNGYSDDVDVTTQSRRKEFLLSVAESL